MRALIDRDIVQPVEGEYRLVGDIGHLAVPDSLHALLAARLDALDPGVRRLVTDAAVLGVSFPAEALIAVSGKDEPTVRTALGELVRREVLTVSADPLSPERGSYQFAQQMLRQVAYETLSRRDRKARHLAVAAHLRAAFAGDGEEVADVIARHYLDALNAAPEDPDAERIRAEAAAARVRAAERAERTGALAQAAASYAGAAELTPAQDAPGQQAAGRLWERAAAAAVDAGDYGPAVAHADRARGYYLQRGQARAAARAQAIAGQALRLWGRIGEARDQLTKAMEVLRADPDRDTVRALGPARDRRGVLRLARRRPAVRRGARAGPGSGRRRGPARRPAAHPRDLPGSHRAAPAVDRVHPGERAPGHPGRRQPQPGTHAEQPLGHNGGH